MKTLPLGIASMKDLTGTLTGNIMAASMISFIPLLIAFIIAMYNFIEGMTLGAVKWIMDYEKNIMLWRFKYVGTPSDAGWDSYKI